MTITNLKDDPSLLSSTLELIEKSFLYDTKNKFEIDFAPLVDKSNHHNCFVMTDDEGKVIAHIGVSERKISNTAVALIGGIAVDEAKRGGGIFQELMMDVIAEKKSDVAFFLLWSDKESLYKKFGFHLCGPQYQILQNPNAKADYIKTKYKSLSTKEQIEIQNLYEDSYSKINVTIERSSLDWSLVEKIDSADLFIKKSDEKISSYFFMNKGQDLHNTIYEYGTSLRLEDELTQMAKYGNIWTSFQLEDDADSYFQFMLSPGDTAKFSAFISRYTNGIIRIKDINSIKQEIYFDFGEDLLGLDTEEFLRGVVGPHPFEELGDIKPIFISGLDSI